MNAFIRYLFPFAERTFRFLRTDTRQEYLLGTLATDLSSFISHLHTRGFEDQLLAWVDDGQIASLRKMDGPEFQFHIRIFNDGEVRGHYEYAPECAPIKHLRRIRREAKTTEFAAFIHRYVTVSPQMHQDTISSVRQGVLAPSYRA